MLTVIPRRDIDGHSFHVMSCHPVHVNKRVYTNPDTVPNPHPQEKR